MGYFDDAQREIDELYEEQLEIERAYLRKRKAVELGISAALIAWLLTQRTNENGTMKAPSGASARRLDASIGRALSPLRASLRPSGRGPGNVTADNRAMASRALASSRTLGSLAAVTSIATPSSLRFPPVPTPRPLPPLTKQQAMLRSRIMTRDNILNIEGVLFNEARGIREMVVRSTGGSFDMQKAKQAARRFRLRRGTFALSTGTHSWGTARGILFDVGQQWQNKVRQVEKEIRSASPAALPKSVNNKVRYMVMAPSRVQAKLAPAGATAGILFRSFTFAGLVALYAAKASQRKLPLASSPDTLGLHHNSRELYIPYPPELEDEASAWGEQRLKEFKDE